VAKIRMELWQKDRLQKKKRRKKGERKKNENQMKDIQLFHYIDGKMINY
jgi:hypothetical protein